jgi:aspartate/methionine/tyrosine aminotransferase
MITAANRLNSVEEYYFSKKLKEVRQLQANGAPVINLGIGSPDLNPPDSVLDALSDSITDPTAHKYQSYQGLAAFRDQISEFYKTRYNVRLDSDKEILPLMGSKEGIMHISMAYLNAGDAVLIPNPGYPTYSSVCKLVGARPIYYDLESKNNWQPDIKALEQLDLNAIKLMWINYPHMPTGAKADKGILKALIDFGKSHDIIIVNDNPYSFILNDNPTSIFNIEGARDVALELNSLSKSFNMAGWRVGMLMGSAFHIENIIKVKSNMDSGMFYGIQKGAIQALKVSNRWFTNLNKIYQKRRDLIWKLANAMGCTFDKNSVGMFVWAKLPNGVQSEDFIDDILKKHHIFIAPGTIFGSNGSGYIRFSLCAKEKDIEEALKRIS